MNFILFILILSILISVVFVVNTNNPVYSVFYLIIIFLLGSVLLFLLFNEFLSNMIFNDISLWYSIYDVSDYFIFYVSLLGYFCLVSFCLLIIYGEEYAKKDNSVYESFLIFFFTMKIVTHIIVYNITLMWKEEKNVLQQSVTLVVMGCLAITVGTFLYEYLFLNENIEVFIKQYDEAHRLYCLQNNVHYDEFRQKTLYSYWRLSHYAQSYTLNAIRIITGGIMSYSIFNMVKTTYWDPKDPGSSGSSESPSPKSYASLCESLTDKRKQSSYANLMLQRYPGDDESCAVLMLEPSRVSAMVLTLKQMFSRMFSQIFDAYQILSGIQSTPAIFEIPDASLNPKIFLDYSRLAELISRQLTLKDKIRKLKEMCVSQFDDFGSINEHQKQLVVAKDELEDLCVSLKNFKESLGLFNSLLEVPILKNIEVFTFEEKKDILKFLDTYETKLVQRIHIKRQDIISCYLDIKMTHGEKLCIPRDRIRSLSSYDFNVLCNQLEIKDLMKYGFKEKEIKSVLLNVDLLEFKPKNNQGLVDYNYLHLLDDHRQLNMYLKDLQLFKEKLVLDDKTLVVFENFLYEDLLQLQAAIIDSFILLE